MEPDTAGEKEVHAGHDSLDNVSSRSEADATGSIKELDTRERGDPAIPYTNGCANQCPEKEKDQVSDSGDTETQRGHPLRPVVTATDWSGPDDLGNPHNWSMRKRIFHAIPPALFSFVV